MGSDLSKRASYITRNYGDNCFYRDSSYKQWNRYHRTDTIINFNYNNTGNCCCNSDFWPNFGFNNCGCSGGFWANFGIGAGWSLASTLFDGLMGGFCNWLFPSSVNTPSWRSYLGDTEASNPVKTKNDKEKDIVTVEKIVEKTVEKKVEVENADAATLDDLSKRLDALLVKKNNNEIIDQNEINNLRKELNAITEKALKDEIQNKSDLQRKTTMLNALDAFNDKTKAAVDGALTTGLDGSYTLSDENLLTLTANIESIPDDKKYGLKMALQNSLSNLKNKDSTYKMSQEYNTLLQLELLCSLDSSIKVNFINREESSDKWIAGPVKNVQKDANNKVTYQIVCNSNDDTIRGTWHVEVPSEANQKAKITGATGITEKTIVYLGMEYEWNSVKNCYINNNGHATGQNLPEGTT